MSTEEPDGFRTVRPSEVLKELEEFGKNIIRWRLARDNSFIEFETKNVETALALLKKKTLCGKLVNVATPQHDPVLSARIVDVDHYLNDDVLLQELKHYGVTSLKRCGYKENGVFIP